MVNKRFIFNVGHGLTPECKIENVKAVIKQVKNYKSWDLFICTMMLLNLFT